MIDLSSIVLIRLECPLSSTLLIYRLKIKPELLINLKPLANEWWTYNLDVCILAEQVEEMHKIKVISAFNCLELSYVTMCVCVCCVRMASITTAATDEICETDLLCAQ